ncbi:MAG: guanylate kinase [Gammaproteobacteria bacterium]
MPGILFVVSAPSGAGKTSLLKALLEAESGLTVSISHTTRPPRPGEEDGVHYHFVDQEAFARIRDADGFLESAQVFDNCYGTSERAVREGLARGDDVVLEIDWQGARQVRRRLPEAVSIFIAPPSVNELRRRLEARAQDSAEVIARRMADAEADLAHRDEYDYLVVNEVFDAALADLRAIVRAERLRGSRGGR